MKNLNKYIFLRPDCWKYFRISNTVLKVCTKYNLTPFEIGSLLYHSDYDNKTPSKIKLVVEKTEKFTSHFKIGRRMRLFSSGSEKEEKEEKEEKKSKNKDKEHKRRQNSFFREDREHRTSLLEASTSVPKDGFDKDENENDEYSHLSPIKKKVKKRKSSSLDQEKEFDSPYNQLYFQNFVMFLEELIKTEYPQKYEMEEDKPAEFELQIEEKNAE